MKIVYNKIIPFKGFMAINLFGIMFVRKEYRTYFEQEQSCLNHEMIHTAQMKDLWYIGFYVAYFLEWIYRLIICPKRAYRSISFEEEAYAHEFDIDYLKTRRKFAQWRR